ncbi:hypothetical protein AZ34_10425 [Hylemonella gracilis str. Niagara R]|uniref:Phage tail collar domain-containing protein n=1 Tax=Hylemonella gracilis str. Niagara R TaxID=1458275 RepID=A0A016XJQ2_9BURK|nr:hypothetical protein AZ34_10425 [Hylemonella gracilis str. Niagara R]
MAALSTAIDLRAPIASAALTGLPTAPTAAPGTNTAQIATTAFVVTAVAALVNSSPAALDTLAELATALGNDANFSTTMTNALAQRVRFLPLATVRALASNSGPIIIDELAGEAWKWSSFGPYFTGYASPYCGEPIYGVDALPRAHEIDAIGGIFNKADHPELWGWAQWRGLVKSQTEFNDGLGSYWFVADPGGDATKFRAPNLLGPNNWGMFLRMAAGGVDADTANAIALGARKLDTMQGHFHGPSSIGISVDLIGQSGTNRNVPQGASTTGGPVADTQHGAPRVGMETTPRFTPFHPRIHK